MAARVRLLPTSVLVPSEVPDGAHFRKLAGADEGQPLVLLVAGIRPVKGVLEAIRLLRDARLAAPAGHPASGLRLLLLGPVLDEAYGEQVFAEAHGLEWIVHLDGVPFEQMTEVYGAANLVLNTSHSEGMSNALLEAMACGKPVLASSVPANLALVGEGKFGLTYRDEREFTELLHLVLGDREFSSRLGAAARNHVHQHHGPDAERDALLEALGEVLSRN